MVYYISIRRVVQGDFTEVTFKVDLWGWVGQEEDLERGYDRERKKNGSLKEKAEYSKARRIKGMVGWLWF